MELYHSPQDIFGGLTRPEGTVNVVAFEAFVRETLLPTLHPRQIVALDYLSDHKLDIARDCLSKWGAKFCCCLLTRQIFRLSKKHFPRLGRSCFDVAVGPF